MRIMLCSQSPSDSVIINMPSVTTLLRLVVTSVLGLVGRRSSGAGCGPGVGCGESGGAFIGTTPAHAAPEKFGIDENPTLDRPSNSKERTL